jgi:hypothetical protein
VREQSTRAGERCITQPATCTGESACVSVCVCVSVSFSVGMFLSVVKTKQQQQQQQRGSAQSCLISIRKAGQPARESSSNPGNVDTLIRKKEKKQRVDTEPRGHSREDTAATRTHTSTTTHGNSYTHIHTYREEFVAVVEAGVLESVLVFALVVLGWAGEEAATWLHLLRKKSFAGAGELADGVPKRSAAVVSATAGLAGVDGLAIGGVCFVCAGREAIADQLTKKGRCVWVVVLALVSDKLVIAGTAAGVAAVVVVVVERAVWLWLVFSADSAAAR